MRLHMCIGQRTHVRCHQKACQPGSIIFLESPEQRNRSGDPAAEKTGHPGLLHRPCGKMRLRLAKGEIHAPSFGLFLSIEYNTGTFWLLARLALILNQGCSCSVDVEGTCCESGHCPAWRLVPPCSLSDRGCHIGLMLALVQHGHGR